MHCTRPWGSEAEPNLKDFDFDSGQAGTHTKSKEEVSLYYHPCRAQWSSDLSEWSLVKKLLPDFLWNEISALCPCECNMLKNEKQPDNQRPWESPDASLSSWSWKNKPEPAVHLPAIIRRLSQWQNSFLTPVQSSHLTHQSLKLTGKAFLLLTLPAPALLVRGQLWKSCRSYYPGSATPPSERVFPGLT